ncbi:hypothetical protein SAMN05444404_0987 [Ruegeria lacuscaerulensis ITI-1157]|nr:hypothetical protein SAMN05444404_0987 [Ruegeria lacuscaerulensis ITI-1157]
MGQIMRHMRLVLRMGRAAGVDLVEAHKSGRLSQADWAGMVRRCQNCSAAQPCHDWLARHDTCGPTFETCPNRAIFKQLRKPERQET